MNDIQIPDNREEIKNDIIINNNREHIEYGENSMASRYYQRYNKQIDRWVKMDSYTGLIVAVKKSKGKYENLPENPGGKIRKRRSFWDLF